MSRTVFVNGEYLPEEQAKVSVFDRGFLMADAVYEVTTVLDGKLVQFDGHMTRLARSLGELQMDAPCSSDELLKIHRRLVDVNDVGEGLVYLQITRGVADRDFAFPERCPPTLVLFTQEKKFSASATAETGIRVVSVEDLRWGRRDIKTTQLLYPSMAKMLAKRKGADDAWMVEDGLVTEGTSNNAYIFKDRKIVTRNLSNDILHGITRQSVLKCAEQAQLKVEQRAFSVQEVKDADEAFITSATTFVTPVVAIDDTPIGNGTVGPIASQLRKIYISESRKTAI